MSASYDPWESYLKSLADLVPDAAEIPHGARAIFAKLLKAQLASMAGDDIIAGYAAREAGILLEIERARIAEVRARSA